MATQLTIDTTLAASGDGATARDQAAVHSEGAAVQVSVTGGPVTVRLRGRVDESFAFVDLGSEALMSDITDTEQIALADIGDIEDLELVVENTSGAEATVHVGLSAQ